MRAAAGDIDFAWRLQQAGWSLEFNPRAVVRHSHRESLPGLLRQVARNGAGAAWLNRRHPGSLPRRPVLRGLARSGGAALLMAREGNAEDAALKVVDALALLAESVGRLADNRPAEQLTPVAPWALAGAVVVTEAFPERSHPDATRLLEELRAEGRRVRVESRRRAQDPSWPFSRSIRTDFWEDDGIARRIQDLAWLTARHPGEILRRLRKGSPARGLWELAEIAPAVRRASRGRERRIVTDGRQQSRPAMTDLLELGLD
jgi:hypothetical protein